MALAYEPRPYFAPCCLTIPSQVCCVNWNSPDALDVGALALGLRPLSRIAVPSRYWKSDPVAALACFIAASTSGRVELVASANMSILLGLLEATPVPTSQP